jgi:pimeloyl-ACP methyl ester carboxylesterase
MAKPTLILVHGAWHSSQCWEKVTPLLTQKGYKCIAPQMQWSAAPEPTPSLIPDIDYLQSLIAAETLNGRNVIMVGHSFGGVASSSSVKGFTAKNPSNLKSPNDGKVVGIVLLTAMVVPTESLFATEYLANVPPGAATHENIGVADSGDFATAKWCLLDPRLDPAYKFYNDLPADEAALWVSRLLKQSFPALITNETAYAGWLDVPMWYLVCEKDTTFEGPFQERMARRAEELGSNVTMRHCDAGHSPFLSKVDETIDFLVEAAEALNG